MTHTPKSERPNAIGGTQKLYEFPNGYGASVVDSPLAYTRGGTYELAVLHNDHICYDTPITNDVLGYLSWPEVEATLDAIAALPAKVTA